MPRRRRARETGTIDLRLGANLRALRLMSGRTTEELAAALDVSVQQMGKYERGDDGIAAATLFP